VGVGLDFIGINPVKALYWTAVINGLLAPFLLVAILVVASDRKLMQSQPSSRLGWTVVAPTTLAMFAAGVAMFVGRRSISLQSSRSTPVPPTNCQKCAVQTGRASLSMPMLYLCGDNESQRTTLIRPPGKKNIYEP